MGGFESSRVTVTNVTDVDPGRRRALLTVGGLRGVANKQTVPAPQGGKG
jgi:hypothetical protein